MNEKNAAVKSFVEMTGGQLQKLKPQIEEIEACTKGKAN